MDKLGSHSPSPFGGLLGALHNAAPQAPVEKAAPPKMGPGTLYIRDTFMPSFVDPSAPHGTQVAGAAREQAGTQPKTVPSFGDEPAGIGFSPEIAGKMQTLGEGPVSKDKTLGILKEKMEHNTSFFLDDQSDYLERATKGGIENSVVNFSLGLSKGSESFGLYNDVMGAVASDNQQQQAQNYANAFGVDVDRLRSKDEGVQKAEEAKLQQGVVNFVSDTFDDSDKIGASLDRWDTAVEKFEGGKNSVVIAAGNEGDVEEAMEGWVGNRQLKLPADFETNVLENDLVTSVGATDGKGKIAEYSNQSSGVDIYANGKFKDNFEGAQEVQGTSFAAPRVAATMAELHRLKPDLSSSQVEQLMKSQLTKPLANGNSSVPLLRPDANYEFLGKQKF